MRLSLISFAACIATTSAAAQTALDVRGSAPFQTSLDGRPYPEYGQIHFRCDTGQCTLQKATILCDRSTSTLSQAVVTPDRVELVQTPTASTPVLKLRIDDFGTNYNCSVKLRPSTNPAGTWHVESYSCSYESSWHGGRVKSERSVRSLAITKVCPGLVLEQSQH